MSSDALRVRMMSGLPQARVARMWVREAVAVDQVGNVAPALVASMP